MCCLTRKATTLAAYRRPAGSTRNNGFDGERKFRRRPSVQLRAGVFSWTHADSLTIVANTEELLTASVAMTNGCGWETSTQREESHVGDRGQYRRSRGEEDRKRQPSARPGWSYQVGLRKIDTDAGYGVQGSQ